MKTHPTINPVIWLSFCLAIFLFSNSVLAQQYINQRSVEERRRAGGYLFSETKYDQFSFMLTPSAIFHSAFQFDLSYRFERTPNAIMVSVANINSSFLGESLFYEDFDDEHEGWAINVYHKYYLDQQEKGKVVYYFAHGPHFNYVEGNTTFYDFNNDPNNFETNQTYSFSRVGYNLTFGFETMLNERFFFDLSIGLGARFLLNESTSGSAAGELNDNLTRTFVGPAYTGLTPLIQTRFGLYIF
jgi:hypothetical protein